MTDRLNKNFLVQGWLVILLCLVFGGSLTAVQLTLSPVIEANKKNEILQIIPGLISEENSTAINKEATLPFTVSPFYVNSEKQGRHLSYAVFEAKDKDGNISGWAARASGQGYADKIELLLGLNPEAEKITGLFILEQKETPGLGNKISEIKWRDQFKGKKTDKAISAIKGKAVNANEIDAITGATISSKSVCRIINQMVGDIRPPLKMKLEESVHEKK
ncbi:MAG: FMN-binding protein [Proteobacteria bacterium]|nr:FMN-binding protein [Pseudomonadota bacterium]